MSAIVRFLSRPAGEDWGEGLPHLPQSAIFEQHAHALQLFVTFGKTIFERALP